MFVAVHIVVVVVGREVLVVCEIVANMDYGSVVAGIVLLHLQYERYYSSDLVVHALPVLVGAYVGAVVFAH